MVSALIFIEGGGDGQLHERSFRKAWSEFFRSAGLSMETWFLADRELPVHR